MKRLSVFSIALILLFSLLSCNEPVEEIKVSSINLNSDALTMTEGESFLLTATVSPDIATDKTVLWSSSNASIASVEEGLVTAVRAGAATITAASRDGGASATCEVTITARTIDVTSVSLSQTSAELTRGQTLTLTAIVKPDDATDKTVTWTTNNAAVATVKDGVVTAVGLGAASITATAGGKNASCTVSVKEAYIAVESVTLNQTSLALNEGDSYTLTATVRPSDATEKTVDWSSSDEKVVTVYGGTVKAVGGGEATVTATAGGKSATCKIQVKARVEVEEVILDSYELTVPVGGSTTLTATVYPNDATDKTVKWSSSDTDVAKVQNGVVSGISAGTAVITATAGEHSANCTVTVYNVPVSSISLDSDFIMLGSGETATLKVIFDPENATDKSVSWTSSDNSVAKVSSGVVTGVAVGTATITATASGKSASCEVKVLNADYLTITNTTNSEGTVTIAPNGSSVPVITLKYSNDNGHTWTELTKIKTTHTITLPAKGSVRLWGENATYGKVASWWSISANVTHEISGDLMSISSDTDKLNSKYEFYKLFADDTKLKSAENLKLPVESLASNCYASMFEGCTSLQKAPKLPAKSLAISCYASMFSKCTSLTQGPDLPATTIAASCYSSMFKNCSGLTKAPELKAETLATGCYFGMFIGCSSLETAPKLPATELANSCYFGMFSNCVSLTSAPVLPATVLANSCYAQMFAFCPLLTSISCMATDISAEGCTTGWTTGVATEGIFTKAASMELWTTGDNGIPEGWEVEDAEED